MKRSIKRQIGGMFIILVGLALTAIWLCNYFFLEEFYVAQKIKNPENRGRTAEQLQYQRAYSVGQRLQSVLLGE